MSVSVTRGPGSVSRRGASDDEEVRELGLKSGALEE